MKTQNTNSEFKIWDIAAFLAKVWFKDQIRNVSVPLYLYWRKPVSGESMAHPIIASEPPNESWHRSILISIAWSTEQATRKIAEAMRELPILG